MESEDFRAGRGRFRNREFNFQRPWRRQVVRGGTVDIGFGDEGQSWVMLRDSSSKGWEGAEEKGEGRTHGFGACENGQMWLKKKKKETPQIERLLFQEARWCFKGKFGFHW